MSWDSDASTATFRCLRCHWPVRRAGTLCTLCIASDNIDALERDVHRTALARNKVLRDAIDQHDTKHAYEMAFRYRERLQFLANDIRRIATSISPLSKERRARVAQLATRLEVLKRALSICSDSPAANQPACTRLETIKT